MQENGKQSKGRIAVVTGATAGIGRAVALSLAAQGAAVVVNGRRADRLQALVEEINAQGRSAPLPGPLPEGEGGRAFAVAGDAADQPIIDAMLDGAVSAFGAEADLVIVNAGRGLGGSVLTSDMAQWEAMYEINVMGAARMLRSAGQRLAPQCAESDPVAKPRDIVVIGSNVGKHISPFSSLYGSSKFAAGALAEATRRELGPKGVRVTLIAPGIVLSEFQEVAGYTDELVEGFKQKFAPLLTPEDIARLVSFVVSQPAGVHACDIVIRPTRQDYP
ncbi:MAG: SDR family NAD(P)-dependent oxidoreductase [Phycisphaeraceae bacterium]|nr:SDR family NAD(P)-dependent oxidoreductase [Phycisphaeraceae bacterium]